MKTIILSCVIFLWIFPAHLIAQNHSAREDFKTKYYNQEIAQKFNSKTAQSNPDFGILPYGEKEGFIEVIDKRTATERYFINIENPRIFYITKASEPINILVDEHWRAIDYKLKEVEKGVFTAPAQIAPTTINTLTQQTAIQGEVNNITFNQVTAKFLYHNNSSIEREADWSNFTFENNVLYITDIFPSIDMEIIARKGEIESTYIIKEEIENLKAIEFIDQFQWDNNALQFIEKYKNSSKEEFYFGDVLIGSSSNNVYYNILPAEAYDGTDRAEKTTVLPYVIQKEKKQLGVHVDLDLLAEHGWEYPIYVDPTVTYSASSDTRMGTHTYPNFCSQDLSVTLPGGSTPLDVAVDWDIEIGFQCGRAFHNKNANNHIGLFPGKRSNAAVWVSNDCVSYPSAPSDYWMCDGDPAYCDATSTVGVYGEVELGLMITFGQKNIWPKNESTIMYEDEIDFGEDEKTLDLIDCYSYSCDDQDIDFTINVSNLDTGTPQDCGCNDVYSRASSGQDGVTYYNTPEVVLESWTVRILGEQEGLALEFTEKTIETTSCEEDPITLNPFPNGGGEDYTYIWSTGEATATIDVEAEEDETITVDISNVCGDTKTVTFNIELTETDFSLVFSDTLIPAPCKGSLLLDPFPNINSSAFDFDWSTGDDSQTITLMPPYSDTVITVDISNLCDETQTVTFDIREFRLLFFNEEITPVDCEADEIIINPQPRYGEHDYVFQWGDNSTDTVFIITPPIYEQVVTVRVLDNCGQSISSTYHINCPALNIEDNTLNNHIQIFPNPVSHLLTVQTKDLALGETDIKLVDNLGRIIFSSQETFSNASIDYQVPVTHFSSGVYSIIITSEKGLFQRKIVIE